MFFPAPPSPPPSPPLPSLLPPDLTHVHSEGWQDHFGSPITRASEAGNVQLACVLGLGKGFLSRCCSGAVHSGGSCARCQCSVLCRSRASVELGQLCAAQLRSPGRACPGHTDVTARRAKGNAELTGDSEKQT